MSVGLSLALACKRSSLIFARARTQGKCFRHASTSTNPYPYPTHTNPTPHQIFHLPRNASAEDVKSRYYDLVRIYHPDSHVSHSIPPATAQARFHAITTAYDLLQGKSLHLSATGEPIHIKKDHHDLSTAMWKAKQRRRAELNIGGIDERWKERLMLGVLVLTIAAFVVQTYSTRQQAMSAARDTFDPDYLRYRYGHRPPSRKTDDCALEADANARVDKTQRQDRRC